MPVALTELALKRLSWSQVSAIARGRPFLGSGGLGNVPPIPTLTIGWITGSHWNNDSNTVDSAIDPKWFRNIHGYRAECRGDA